MCHIHTFHGTGSGGSLGGAGVWDHERSKIGCGGKGGEGTRGSH